MKLRKFKSNEHGAVVVLVALSLTALFGFTALAVDFGMMASNKQGMQNACDAAALAAATDIKDGKSDSVITSTGYTYSKVNGFDNNADDTQVTVTRNGNQVTVTIQQEMQMGFSGVLTGERTRTVSATATAETTSVFRGCPYTLFADTGGITSNSGGTIDGTIHSNSSITARNPITVSDSSIVSARGSISGVSGGDQRPNTMPIDMPKIAIFEKALSDSTIKVVVYNGDRKNDDIGDFIEDARRKSGLTDAELRANGGLYIHVKGGMKNVKGEYETTNFPVILIVDDDLKMQSQCTLASSAEAPIYIMSGGDMFVTGGDKGFYGIVYAPEGDIKFTGGPFTYYGAVIGHSITKTGGTITGTHYEGIDGYLPDGKVHLVS